MATRMLIYTAWARQSKHVKYTVWVKKRKPRLDSKFLKIEKRYNKIDLSAWSHNYSTFISYIVNSYSAMDGCTAIHFVIHVKIGFVQVGVVCAAWWHLQELSQQINNSCIHTALCTMTKLEDSFDMLLQKWVLGSHPSLNMNDQCTIWNKNNMLQYISSTDNNFMFFFWEI